ncbi:MAG: ABC transporter permease, partial [Deltaproteobacteria bacterium]|nr:ABC transporter permease [Deltaproteobacteria bacterium]
MDGLVAGLAAVFRSRRGRWGHLLLLGPLVGYLLVFFLYPLWGVLIESAFDPELTGEHYLAILKYPVYMRVLWNTLQISILVTLLCVLLGYPIAYYLSSSKSNWAAVLLIAVVLPFWISVLVRTYAWMMILGRYGVINNMLKGLGLVDHPIRLMYNRIGVCVGMVYVMLPYAILPMLSVMQGIDRRLVQAADNLGSTPWQSFKNVFFPLSLPGVGAALLLTFIVCVGFFVTPALMGGPRDTMIAISIQTQLEEVSNWGFASALSVVLLCVVLILFFIYNRFLGLDMLLGG